MRPLTMHLGEWAADLRAGAIPPAVLRAAKQAMLDCLAVGVAGQESRVAGIAKELAPIDRPERGAATLWGGPRGSPREAAFANAVAAHAYDMDDTSFAGILHGSAAILPAALAEAEARKASGEDLLTAFVTGSEAAYALGSTVGSGLYDRGWWPTGLLAGIGAAAAVAKLRFDTAEGIARAIAFSAVSASGFRALHGSDAKPLGVGDCAARAFEAATRAGSSASAPLDVFERPESPLTLTVGRRIDLAAAREVGHTWRLLDPGLVFKCYPFCSCVLPAADALLELMEQHGLAADDIVSIDVQVTPMVATTLRFDRPQTSNQAIFSLPYALACIAVDRGASPAHLDPASINRADLQQLMERIGYEANADFFDTQTSPEAAELTLETADHRRFTARRLFARGHPSSPLSRAQFEEKARGCLESRLSPLAVSSLLDLLAPDDSIPSTKNLTQCLHKPEG